MSTVLYYDKSPYTKRSINYKLFEIIGQIMKSTIRQRENKFFLLYGSGGNFTWMFVFDQFGISRLCCSITSREITEYYEINMFEDQINIYSYEWKRYAGKFGNPTIGFVLENDAYFISSLDKFKIILLDILQDVALSLDDEFYLSSSRFEEYIYARNWFLSADRVVQICKT